MQRSSQRWSAGDGLFHLSASAGIGNTLVQGHHNVAPQLLLDVQGDFGGQFDLPSLGPGKAGPLLGNGSLLQTKDLKAPRNPLGWPAAIA